MCGSDRAMGRAVWRRTRPKRRARRNRLGQMRGHRLGKAQHRYERNLGWRLQRCARDAIPATRVGLLGRFAGNLERHSLASAAAAKHHLQSVAICHMQMRLRAIGEIAKACNHEQHGSEE